MLAIQIRAKRQNDKLKRLDKLYKRRKLRVLTSCFLSWKKLRSGRISRMLQKYKMHQRLVRMLKVF
jgi:hypothetical protein